MIRDAGHEVEYRSTCDDGWERALEEPADLVVAAGGDGTVGKILRQVARAPRLVTVLPLGSANNIARAFGLADREPEELARGWADAPVRPFRVGELRTPDGRDTFLEAFGGGLFAESIVHGEKHDDAGPEKVEIGLRLLRRLVEELPTRPWRLELDGTDESGDYVSVEALAIGLTGPSIPLAPRSDPSDALLDVVAVSDADRHAFATYLDARIAGRDAEAPKLTARRCCEASLWPPRSQPLRLDDELIEDAHWRSNGGHAAVAAGAVLEVLAPE